MRAGVRAAGWAVLGAAALGSVAYVAFGGSDDRPPASLAHQPGTLSAVPESPTASVPGVKPPEVAASVREASGGGASECPAEAELSDETYRDGTRGRGCARRNDGGVVRLGWWNLVDPLGYTLVGEYVDGEREGKWAAYYPSREVFQVVYYEHGKKNGAWIQWTEDGRKIFEREYVDDVQDGWAVDYDQDGGYRRTRWNHGVPEDAPPGSP